VNYQPFYCEENVWHLAQEMRGRGARVIFVSNADRACAMFKQVAGDPIVWDYHVVLWCEGQIYDRDSRLAFPVSLDEWIAATFPVPLPQMFRPKFRVVDADRFVEVFASDRSHMRTKNGWQKPPPSWPPIGEGTNLMRFVDMEQEFEGKVSDLGDHGESLRALLVDLVPLH
jgi:protein N-terminal glutamine amidohydrolase